MADLKSWWQGGAMREPRTAESAQIERSVPHALFSELLAVALAKTPLQPSPMAIAYMVELLGERIHPQLAGPGGHETLAEALLAAQQDRGAQRICSMRELGDHALFVSGFFGESLARREVDLDYYEEVGRGAYKDVMLGLQGQGTDRGWARLYRELAQDFANFVDLLAEVGDQSRTNSPANPCPAEERRQSEARGRRLLRAYERYMHNENPRDRRLLIRSGQLPPKREGVKWWN
jgi:hypothetical protein